MTGTRDELQRLMGGAGSALRIAVISPFNASETTIAAAAGNHDAKQAIRQVERALKVLRGFVRPDKKSPLCLFCPTILWRRHLPDAIIIISPYWDESRQMACHFVCHDCCVQFADGEALNDALLGYYRRKAAPSNLRVLPQFPPAGRA
jgi:hypothetical protein